MHPLIHKVFKKRNIKDPVDLSPEEKSTFDQWQVILSRKELTIEEIKEYCESQVSAIENKWSDYEYPEEKKAKLLPYYSVYKTLTKVIGAPQTAREALEKHLNQLINA